MSYEQLPQVRADLVHYLKHEPKHYWCTENFWGSSLLPSSDNSTGKQGGAPGLKHFTIHRTLIPNGVLISREKLQVSRIKSKGEKEGKLLMSSLQVYQFFLCFPLSGLNC